MKTLRVLLAVGVIFILFGCNHAEICPDQKLWMKVQTYCGPMMVPIEKGELTDEESWSEYCITDEEFQEMKEAWEKHRKKQGL